MQDSFGNWLAGFTDGEGNFQYRQTHGRSDAMFRIILREDDKKILEEIRNNLGCGKLFYRDMADKSNWNPLYQSKNMRNQWVFKVQNTYDLIERIIPLFDKYPLRAKKKKQYEKWKKQVIEKWERICKRGIKEVV